MKTLTHLMAGCVTFGFGRFLCFNGGGVWGGGSVPVGCIWPPGGLGCCPFWGGGSVVVDFLFVVTPIVGVCGCSVF